MAQATAPGPIWFRAAPATAAAPWGRPLRRREVPRRLPPHRCGRGQASRSITQGDIDRLPGLLFNLVDSICERKHLRVVQLGEYCDVVAVSVSDENVSETAEPRTKLVEPILDTPPDESRHRKGLLVSWSPGQRTR